MAETTDPVSAVDTPCVPPTPTSCTVDLPAEMLAHVLNFMPYSDVRVTFQAGRRLAIDAAHKVKTLNVTEASELVVGPRDKPLSLRRFPNVKEINCMSLVYDNGLDGPFFNLCARTLLRVVPFLVSFPKLEKAFVGGGYSHNNEEKLEYNTVDCDEPENHETLFRSLIEQFCVEFMAGGLPPKLHLRGILPDPERFRHPRFVCLDYHEEQDDFENETKACSLCRSICAYFPSHAAIDVFPCFDLDDHYGQTSLCIGDAERIRRVGRRPGFPFQAETAVIVDLLESLPNVIRKHAIELPSESDAIIELSRQMKEEEQPYTLHRYGIVNVSKDHYFTFQYLSEEGLCKLKKILQRFPRANRGNVDICHLAMDKAVSNHLRWLYGNNVVWDETSLKRLASLGFGLYFFNVTIIKPCLSLLSDFIEPTIYSSAEAGRISPTASAAASAASAAIDPTASAESLAGASENTLFDHHAESILHVE